MEERRTQDLPTLAITLTGQISGWNPAADASFGVGTSPTAGRSFGDLLHPDELNDWSHQDLRVPSATEALWTVATLAGKATYRWLSLPILHGTEVIGRTLIALERAPGAVETAPPEPSDNPELLAEVMELTREGVFDWEIGSDSVVWNEPLREMVGVYVGQPLPRLSEVLRRIHPEDRRPTLRALRDLLQTGKTERYEFRLRRPDRTWRWLRVDARCTRDGNRPVRLRGSVRDLTNRRQKERRAEREIDELERRVADRTRDVERANAELRAFCYSVSHDLRSPLRSIHGFGTALERDYAARLPAEARDHLARMRKAALQMSTLIDALLGMARISQVDVESLSFDLTQAVHEIRTRSAPAHPSVRWMIAPDVQATGDPRLIRTLLEVLVDNALKFSTPSGAPEVEFGVVRRVRHAIFFVRDNGAGFDPRYATRLFQPFERLHNASEFPGNGVGLALARRIVGRHGGTIWAESSPGAGATFYFTLAPSGLAAG